MNDDTRFVSLWGQLWAMTPCNFYRFLQDGAAGLKPDASKYGTLAGTYVIDLSDAGPDEYAEELDVMNDEAKREVWHMPPGNLN